MKSTDNNVVGIAGDADMESRIHGVTPWGLADENMGAIADDPDVECDFDTITACRLTEFCL